ncbi:cationic amino acid transporter 6, chloroplastic [Trifolium repens]|nr:cationic amino acid transporter 6, chloroplastic [Trifolium repens]
MTSKKEKIQKKIKNKGMETCSKRRHGHRCHVRNNMSSSSIFAIVKWRKLFKGMPLVGIFTTAIALFTDLDVLLNLVSIGTLFVFYMVTNVVVYRRYVVAGATIFFLGFISYSLG